MAEPRVGLGFDVHPSDPSRELVLAGVPFPGEAGLAGHSDADVVCHALADALLGAAALGDLGDHFPEADPSVAGMPGPALLARTVDLLRSAGLRPASCDVVVVLAHPSIAPKRGEMREVLAGVLGLDAARVSLKATRPEGLGLVGEGAGCFAVAVVAPA